jgi:hypothetical protein
MGWGPQPDTLNERAVAETAAELVAQQQRDDQVRAETWAKAVQALRDDQRYQNWWSALPQEHPDYGYWSANPRRQFADYLEAVGPDDPATAAETGQDGADGAAGSEP